MLDVECKKLTEQQAYLPDLPRVSWRAIAIAIDANCNFLTLHPPDSRNHRGRFYASCSSQFWISRKGNPLSFRFTAVTAVEHICTCRDAAILMQPLHATERKSQGGPAPVECLFQVNLLDSLPSCRPLEVAFHFNGWSRCTCDGPG